jgi:transcriptional regulator with XRE-family HTH domain
MPAETRHLEAATFAKIHRANAAAVRQSAAAADSGFGQLLRTLRARANLTQEALAERSGLSVKSISSLERGRRLAPRGSTVEYLAKALRLPQEDRDALFAAAQRQRCAGGVRTLDAVADRDELPLDAAIDIGGGVRLHHLGTQRLLDGSIPSAVTFVVAAGGGAGLVAGAVGGYLDRVAARLQESSASPAQRVAVKLRCGERRVRLDVESGTDLPSLYSLLIGVLAGCGAWGEAAGDSGRMAIRHGFVLDVAGYGPRSVPDRGDVQRRLDALVREVLLDLGIEPGRADLNPTGDGMIVLLPEGGQFQRLLPLMLQATVRQLAADNRRHTDRLRLRMATSIGPVGHGATGYTGDTVTEMCRLVDSEPLRRALESDPAADLVVVVSNVLYGWVVGGGHPGLDTAEFRPIDVRVKSFQAPAWLWAPPCG